MTPGKGQLDGDVGEDFARLAFELLAELHDERGEDFGVLFIELFGDFEGLGEDDAAVHHLEVGDEARFLVAGDGEHVDVGERVAHDGGLGLEGFQLIELDLELVGQLVLHFLGGGGHALAEVLLGNAQVAVENLADLLDVGVVGGLVFAGHAGGVAVTELEFEAGLELAGFHVFGGELVGAGAQGVEGADEFEQHVQGRAVGVGAVVARAVGALVAGGDEAWEPLVGEAEVGVGLAVFQQNVVLGLVLLDEVVFQQKGV